MKNKNDNFGFWESPISAEMVASNAKRFSQIQCDQGCVYWLEQRPSESGRQVVMCKTAAGEVNTKTPNGFNVRTRVHEYGGGDYCVKDGIIYFVNAADQRIYQQAKNKVPVAVSPPSLETCYADFIVTNDHHHLIAVRETQRKGQEAKNDLVSINLNKNCEIHILAEGYDFYSSPVLNSDESKLAWLCWSHPQMPWDGTELWCADLEDMSLKSAQKIAGGHNESLYQPSWSNAGDLYVVSDQTGWWNIYRIDENGLSVVVEMNAEFGTTQWVFGTRMYAFTANDNIICIVTKNASQEIGIVSENKFLPFDVLQTTIDPYIAVQNDEVYFIGASPLSSAALYQYHLDQKYLSCISKTSDVVLDEQYLSCPASITFPAAGDQLAHAFYYAPKNPEKKNIKGLPPLIVFCHGGPVAFTSTALNLKIQYWTSRGFAVVDVNYGGSGGYGRAYRERLKGKWGVVDVADCVGAARFLVDRKLVDPDKLFIRGSSAGGFTVLNALAHYDLFLAGASYYGISDLTGLLGIMPKFESRDLDALVGEYSRYQQRYYDRSPVNFANQIKASVIFFQGLKDPVVPPQQAETMIAALSQTGVKYRYVTFSDERHGFKDGQSIIKSLIEELAFYQLALYTDDFSESTRK